MCSGRPWPPRPAPRRAEPARSRCWPASASCSTATGWRSAGPTSSSPSNAPSTSTARATAVASCRASSPREAVRTLAPGSGRGGRRWRHRGHHAPTARRSPCGPFAVDDFPRLDRAAGAGGDPARRRRSCLAVSQVERAASKDESRPILTGVLLTAEEEGPAPRRHRLVPAGGVRPPRRLGPGSRARRCCCRRGRCASWSARCRRPGRSPCGWASATRRSRPAGTRISTRLIEGEFPNYRQLIPSALPEPRADGARAAARRDPPDQGAGRGRHAGPPHHRGRRGPR